MWGEHGQKALSDASVLLIGGNAVGTEAMKNLVLPGIGRFTVLDHEKVTESDCGNNFFVTQESIGESRAKTVCELLSELNPDVVGEYIDSEFSSDMIESQPFSFFGGFSLILCASYPTIKTCLQLSDLCYKHEIPFILMRSCGQIGYVRNQLVFHDVIEPKSDSIQYDLRIYPNLEIDEKNHQIEKNQKMDDENNNNNNEIDEEDLTTIESKSGGGENQQDQKEEEEEDEDQMEESPKIATISSKNEFQELIDFTSTFNFEEMDTYELNLGFFIFRFYFYERIIIYFY